MPLTHILVDLENVQLRLPDLAGLSRERHRLTVFHGPSQNKLTIELVRALQPLGDAVDYIQCEKAGPNALDFHLAYHLGRLNALHPQDACTIVSRDKGFAQLVAHGRKRGHAIEQVAQLRLGVGESDEAAPRPDVTTPARKAARKTSKSAAPAKKVAKAAAEAPKAAAAKKATPARKAAAAKKTLEKATEKAPARTAAAVAGKTAARPAAKKAAARTTPKSATKQAAAPAAEARALRSAPIDADLHKALDSLRRMAAAKRPVRRSSLQHHLASHLRGELDAAGIEALLERLEASGWIAREGARLVYRIEPA